MDDHWDFGCWKVVAMAFVRTLHYSAFSKYANSEGNMCVYMSLLLVTKVSHGIMSSNSQAVISLLSCFLMLSCSKYICLMA